MSFTAAKNWLIDFPEKWAPTMVKHLLPVCQILQNFTEGNTRKYTVSFAFCAHVDVINYFEKGNPRTLPQVRGPSL